MPLGLAKVNDSVPVDNRARIDYPSTQEVDYPSTLAVDYPSTQAVSCGDTQSVRFKYWHMNDKLKMQNIVKTWLSS